MEIDVKWLVGAIFGVVALVGAAIARDRQVSKSIKDGDDVLHARINRVKDEYVRKDDWNNHIDRLETGMSDIKSDISDHNAKTTERLDKLFDMLSRK